MKVTHGKFQCPGCGGRLRAGVPEGLCPKCLFSALIQPGSDRPVPLAMERFGDYELLDVVARGGSGVVYRARQAGLDRVVALKLLAAEVGGDAEFLERFRAEAAAAAALEHPHIIPVYDFGEHQGRHFLAMKLIEGGPATSLMEPEPAARRLITVARAVLHAHQRGVLHRDLKPANILLDGQGEPYLADFGLAKLTAMEATITRTRSVLGTPAYMAPEQAEGRTREITTAADVYGLGAVLYHWLTGGPPFAGGTTVETIRLVIEADPEPPSRRCPRIDRDLDTICLKCLRKEPGQRYATVDALAADLERWLRGEPILARPVSSSERLAKWMRRNRALSAVLGVSAAGMLAAAGALAWKNRELAHARSETAALAARQRDDLVRLHVANGNALAEEGDGYAALASFAEAAALEADDPDRLFVHRFRFAATRALIPQRERVWRHEGEVQTSSFSADGTRVVTASADRTARVWEVATGRMLTPALPHAAGVWWAGFGESDTRVVTRTRSGEVHLWDAGTGAPSGGPFSGREDMPDIHDGLAKPVPLSPDGRIMVVLKPEAVELRFVRDGGLVREPLTCPPKPGGAAFTEDGTRLAVACEDGGVSVFEVASGEVVASLPAGAAHGTDHPPVGWRSVAWSPRGDRLALTDRAFSARLMPADAASFSQPLLHQFMVLGSQWNDEGTRLMTWSFDNTLRLWDATTGEAVLVPVRHRGPVLDAALSPGGTWCASACRDGSARLWRVGSGFQPGPVLRHAGEVRDVAWSADGRRLVTSSADRTAQLWRVEGTGSAPTECRHRGSVERLAVSPDGRHVATVCLDPNLHVSVWRFPDGGLAGQLVHPSLAASAAWRDARRLVTVTGDGALRTWDTATGKLLDLTPAFPDLPGRPRSLQLSPDAAHLLVVFEDVPAMLVATGGRAARVTLEGGPAGAGYWSPCGRFLATTHAPDGIPVVRVRDGATGLTLETVPASEIPLALGPGGRHLALVDEAYRVFVLERASGRRSPLMPHDAVVQAAHFTADGRILATGTRDGTLRFWDASTGEAASPPMPHASWIMAIGSDAEGRRFFTGVNGGVLSEWEVPPCHLSPDEMAASALVETSANRAAKK